MEGEPRWRRGLTFVLPAFNEADNIVEAVRRCLVVGQELAPDGLAFEVIVVDDGSSDATRALAGAVAAQDPRVRTLHHPTNRGYGAALKTGLLAARLEWVFFTDADLQFDVGEVRRLLRYADRYGIVAGYRAPRSDPWRRRVNGWVWSRLVGALFGLGVRDVDCAFKLFHRRIFEHIEVQSIGAFVNTEILVRATAEGFSVKEVPVSHFPRQAGVNNGAHPRVVVKALREMTSLYGELRTAQRAALPETQRLARTSSTARAS